MLRVVLVVSMTVALLPIRQGPAKNVVLFLADAGGIPTINAASLHGYGAPRQAVRAAHAEHRPVGHVAARRFVSDSAAGMTAIVTGQKTNNGVIAQSARGARKVRTASR